MNEPFYMTHETYLHCLHIAANIRHAMDLEQVNDLQAAEDDLFRMQDIIARALIAPKDETGLPCHHFPAGAGPVGQTELLDADSEYRFLLCRDATLTADVLQPMLRFAGYLDGEVAFAMIDQNVVVMLELDECGSCRADFERAVHRAMDEALSEMPDFRTRTQTDGTGLVFRGRAVIALVPFEEVDHLRDDVPIDAALDWRDAALDACGDGFIHLLAVPEGQERLLRGPSVEYEDEAGFAFEPAEPEAPCEPTEPVLPANFADLLEPLPPGSCGKDEALQALFDGDEP